ncbi:MAG: hypothetical protein EXR57_01945 [Dehalococcoidia bacterium]|nr:hypothetical protein [Dehalococcoidia bacterium]
MGTLLGTALVLLALGVVTYPFLRRRTYALPPDVTLERLRAERLRIYRQITDLEADRASGEIPDQDYQAQLGVMRVAAAKVMREEAAHDGEPELEREIAAERQARKGPPEGETRV